ncbi:MAG: hypothetical protein ACXIUD_07365 [Mongoliitalea sp.]
MEVTKLISELKTRWQKPTPPFFQKLGQIGMILAGVGGAILTVPVALPAVLISAGSYLFTAGIVITSISQVTIDIPVEDEKD